MYVYRALNRGSHTGESDEFFHIGQPFAQSEQQQQQQQNAHRGQAINEM